MEDQYNKAEVGWGGSVALNEWWNLPALYVRKLYTQFQTVKQKLSETFMKLITV